MDSDLSNPTDVASFEPSSPATVQLCSSRPSTPGSDLDSCEEQVITNKSSVRPPPSPISLTEASCTVGMQANSSGQDHSSKKGPQDNGMVLLPKEDLISLVLSLKQRVDEIDHRKSDEPKKCGSNTDNPNFPITADVIKSIPFTTVSRYVAALLPQLYDEETLASHSLDGRKSNRHQEGNTIRPGLPATQKQDIFRAVTNAAKETNVQVTIRDVHLAITTKLSNCLKRSKKLKSG